MEIRLATADDLPAILDISNWAAAHTAANFALEPEPLDAWRADWRGAHEAYPWLVACEDDVVLGFAKASRWLGRCAYEWSAELTVYVHPDHRGRRVGSALYARLLPLLERQGFRTVLAGIALPNEASVRLHEAAGLRKMAHLERVGWKFGRWHDVGYWGATLGDGADPPAPRRTVREAWAAPAARDHVGGET